MDIVDSGIIRCSSTSFLHSLTYVTSSLCLHPMLNGRLRAGRFQGIHVMAAESQVCKIMNTHFLKHKIAS